MLVSPVIDVTISFVCFQRAVAETAEMSLGNTCFNSTPCGWLVYVPFTRRADYFMKNTCECPKGMSCLRTDDDLSVSAYVYRCRTESSTNDSS
uniref:Uncharacterized protein n=2 Tax=Timema TaxID=61471 RepID=A0A7R9DED0_TIMCR|nr:unnamed protein product [Timema cristinae]